MDWIDKMNQINLRLAKLNKLIDINDIFTASSCIINDYECTKKLLQIPPQTWEKLLASLYELDKIELAYKIELLVCYINELKRLAGVNLQALVGLTRDDVAAMQRICVTKKNATEPATKFKVIETLTSLLDSAAEADENNRYLTQKSNVKTMANN